MATVPRPIHRFNPRLAASRGVVNERKATSVARRLEVARIVVGACLLACVCAEVVAAECNVRIDDPSNPLLEDRVHDESLLHLAPQGVKELQEWTCVPEFPCTGFNRTITRLDRLGRVIEVVAMGVVKKYAYEGNERYPSLITSIANMDTVAAQKGRVLSEYKVSFSNKGVPVGESGWSSHGDETIYVDHDRGTSRTYRNGRLIAEVEMTLGYDGFPKDSLVEKECKVRKGLRGDIHVATHVRAKGARESTSRLTNEAIFDAQGNWLWNMAHRPNGTTLEQAYAPRKFDRKKNWVELQARLSNGESRTSYREITYWDDL